jgi:hypothetical protein
MEIRNKSRTNIHNIVDQSNNRNFFNYKTMTLLNHEQLKEYNELLSSNDDLSSILTKLFTHSCKLVALLLNKQFLDELIEGKIQTFDFCKSRDNTGTLTVDIINMLKPKFINLKSFT